MIEVKIDQELYDSKKDEFFQLRKTISLEHSLASIAEWESKWKKSFLSSKEKTTEELLDYIRFMAVNKEDRRYVAFMSSSDIKRVIEYLGESQTALQFSKESKPSNDVITCEKIYYLMFVSNIDISCEHWNITRLMALIRYISEKNEPPKKMSHQELLQRNAKLNAERCKRLKTRG